MRPDDHKKRKNTQYKKKHGLTADDNSQKTSKSSGKTVKSDRNTRTNPTDSGNKDPKGEKKADLGQQGASNNTVFSDDEELSYQKRRLVSNWSRYDDLPSDDDEDIPLQRGEDFSKLLAEAGGSAAQFRFKDEEDWSGEVEATSSGTSVLALDLEEIAKSVMCLPLHERLGIDKDVFTIGQLEEIQSTCTEHLNKYDASHGGVVTVDKPVQNSLNYRQTAISDRNIDITNRRNKTKVNTVNTKPDCKQKSADSVKSTKAANTNVPDLKKTESTKPKELANLEDDLDLLLSLDEPDKQSAEQSNKTVQYKADNKTVGSENEGKTSDDKQTNKKSDTSKEEKDKGDNLEDWLDSMLDD